MGKRRKRIITVTESNLPAREKRERESEVVASIFLFVAEFCSTLNPGTLTLTTTTIGLQRRGTVVRWLSIGLALGIRSGRLAYSTFLAREETKTRTKTENNAMHFEMDPIRAPLLAVHT